MDEPTNETLLGKYTPFLSMKLPLPMVASVVEQLGKSPTTSRLADNLQFAYEEVTKGEFSLERYENNVRSLWYDHRTATYMEIFNDLLELQKKKQLEHVQVDYQIVKVGR